MGDLERRLSARQKVNDFFKSKRDSLNVKGVFDFSLENKTKRRFLAEMNALEKDFEYKAIGLADKRKDANLDGEMHEKFEKLKKSFIDDISGGGPAQDAVYKNVVNEISRL